MIENLSALEINNPKEKVFLNFILLLETNFKKFVWFFIYNKNKKGIKKLDIENVK